jgi:hypothetical protein
MPRASKPKMAAGRTNETQDGLKAPLADSGDSANPADEIEGRDAGGSDASWRWHGSHAAGRDKGFVKGDSASKMSAAPPGPVRRRTRATPRPASPRGRTR